MSGKTIFSKHIAEAQAGTYIFRIQLSSPQTYVLSARQGKNFSSIKMVNVGTEGENSIVLLEHVDGKQLVNANKSAKANVNHPWAYGDNLEITGVSTICGTDYSQLLSMQLINNETVIFDFPATFASCDGLPCPGATTITDFDSNTYNTVQIGNQCWMKENLRTTHYANGDSILFCANYPYSSYEICYCYAPNNNIANVPTHGYLYNWAAVTYTAAPSLANPQGVQSICPFGWHVPSLAEWTQLSDYVSSQPHYRCNNAISYIAMALADTVGWSSSTTTCAVGNNLNANNATGFSASPAGIFAIDYVGFGTSAIFWSSTSPFTQLAYIFWIKHDSASMVTQTFTKYYGLLVRCLRD